jgi:glutathione S-transferase
MLKIWGRKNSINVIKVLWLCDELGLKYERVDLGGAFGGLDTPQYQALNPNGRVPTIEDDGFVLWESNVIVRYLSAKHASGTLYPTDARQRAEAERWMDWQQTEVGPALLPIFWGFVRTQPEKRDLPAIEKARVNLARILKALDARLATSKFVAGDNLTMGDIPVGCATFRWFNLPIERPPLPNLEAWYKRLTERPGYKTHAMQPLT